MEFGIRVLRIMYGPKERKWQEDGESYTLRSLRICTFHQVLLGLHNSIRWTGHAACVERREMHPNM
jgi:hypothetical protein